MRPLATLLACSAGLAGAARADFVASGQFLYVDREYSYDNGYTGTEPNLPVRFADVRVENATTGALLAQGFTDALGSYAITVVATGTASVRVRCVATSLLVGGRPVRVETTAGVVYTTTSPTFPSWNLSTNLAVGTLVAPKVFSGVQQGNPFNLLDAGLRAFEYIQQPAIGAGPSPATLVLRWPGGSGSFASGATVTMAVDDGYDDPVAFHEIGHAIHYLYSDSDSPGGAHGFAQSNQDPRLSFGEGWASFFGGAVRRSFGDPDPGFYLDADNDGSTGPGTIQLRMRFENGAPYAGSTGGEADEGAVFCALWDLIDDAATADPFPGDDDPFDGSIGTATGASVEEAHWDVFVGPVSLAPNLTIADFWNGWFFPVDFGNEAQLADLFEAWKVRFFEDEDEPNGSIGGAESLSPGSTFWSTVRTLYDPVGANPAPGTGDLDHFRFFVPAGATILVETRYPGANPDAETFCDPALVLYDPAGAPLASAEGGGYDRNALIGPIAAAADGYYTARVSTNSLVRPYGSYEVRALLTQFATAPILGAPFPTFDAGAGGSIPLSLYAGVAQAGRPYLVLAGASGDYPGTPLAGGLLLPLNVDALTTAVLGATNTPTFAGFFGTLSVVGAAFPTVNLPPIADPAVLGAEFTFAAVVFAPGLAAFQRVSSSVTVAFAP